MPYQVVSFEDDAVGGGTPYFRWGVDGRVRAFSGINASLDVTAVAVPAGFTDGGLLKAGDADRRVSSAADGMKFVSLYVQHTGDGGYGLYVRDYIAAAAKSNDAFRAFATVQNVAAATVRGAHVSLSFGASGSVSGLGAALECTLHMPSAGGMAGTNYAIKAAINSDGALADPAGATTIAFLGFVQQGTQAGLDDFEDDGVVFDFSGFNADADNLHILSSVSLAELPASTVGLRCKVGASLYYLPLVAQAQWN